MAIYLATVSIVGLPEGRGDARGRVGAVLIKAYFELPAGRLCDRRRSPTQARGAGLPTKNDEVVEGASRSRSKRNRQASFRRENETR